MVRILEHHLTGPRERSVYIHPQDHVAAWELNRHAIDDLRPPLHDQACFLNHLAGQGSQGLLSRIHHAAGRCPLQAAVATTDRPVKGTSPISYQQDRRPIHKQPTNHPPSSSPSRCHRRSLTPRADRPPGAPDGQR